MDIEKCKSELMEQGESPEDAERLCREQEESEDQQDYDMIE
ncbi:MAG TPA: hypothetical protein VLS90_17380 [Thermodesulfobacteriota bacterium]|nr:hypothetical protein [Thermodesulfobacteriota bacterium]